MGHRHELTQEQWSRLEPLPPKARRGPHLRAEGVGKLMTLLVTAGQRHEQPQFVPLMEHGAVA